MMERRWRSLWFTVQRGGMLSFDGLVKIHKCLFHLDARIVQLTVKFLMNLVVSSLNALDAKEIFRYLHRLRQQ